MAKEKKPNPTNLPDELYYKKKGHRGSKKKEHQDEFFKELKPEDINPNGKEDFDATLRAFLEDDKEEPEE